MAKGMISYRDMLSQMRSRDRKGKPKQFDLMWVQVDGSLRTEHGVVLTGQKDYMQRQMLIDIRYPNGTHHDTKVRINNIIEFNGKRMFL